MNTGDIITESDLIQKGFYFSRYFNNWKVFLRYDQVEDEYTYVFHSFRDKTVITTFQSKEWN